MRPNDIGLSNFDKNSLNDYKPDLKEKTIQRAVCLGDLNLLRTLARSRLGLVTNELRREIWPVLLRGSIKKLDSVDTTSSGQITDANITGIVNDDISRLNNIGSSNSNNTTKSTLVDWHNLPSHPEEDQVQLDVDRSFVFYPTNLDTEKRMLLQQDLRDLIVCVLRRNPHLSYYQGYHDVAQVILLIFGSDASAEILEMLSLAYLRDFMLPDLTATLQHLRLLPTILSQEDPSLGELLGQIGEPFFALSPILTLFAHHIRSQQDICIVFDFILGSGTASLPLYMLAVMILEEKTNFEKLRPNDHDSQHLMLSNMADNFAGDWFEIAKKASNLQEKISLESLPPWSQISKFSVLKTTRETGTFNRTNVLDYLDCQVREERAIKELEKKQRGEEIEKQKQESQHKRKESRALIIYRKPKSLISPFVSNNFLLPRSVLALTVGVGVFALVGSSVFKYDVRLIWHNVQDYLTDRS